MDITGTPTFRLERGSKMKTRMKSVVVGLVIIIVIMVAYICTIPSVKSREDDKTNLKWLQQIIDENVKKKMAMKNLYRPYVNNNNAKPEIPKLNDVNAASDHLKSNTFQSSHTKLNSKSTNDEPSRVETDRHLLDKTMLSKTLKNFDLPLDMFARASSTPPSSTSTTLRPLQQNWKILRHEIMQNQMGKISISLVHRPFGTTTTTTRPMVRQFFPHATLPILAASSIAKSFGNKLPETGQPDTRFNNRNPDDPLEKFSHEVSAYGHDKNTILPSSENEYNFMNSRNRILSLKDTEKNFEPPTKNSVPPKSETNTLNAQSKYMAHEEHNVFNKINNILSENKEIPQQVPYRGRIDVSMQTDPSNIRKDPSLKSNLANEGDINNHLEESGRFLPTQNIPRNGMDHNIANTVKQNKPLLGGDNKLRDYMQSLIEKVKVANKAPSLTHENDKPRSYMPEPVDLPEKTEKPADQSASNGYTEDRKVPGTSIPGNLQPNQPKPDEGHPHDGNKDTGTKRKPNGLIDNLKSVENSRIKICKSYTLEKPKYGSCQRLQTLTAPVQLCTHPVEQDYKMSGSVRQRESWEFPMMTNVVLAMLETPGSGLIDIGAGVGAYTITAAAHRHPVIAVEPYMPHVRLLQKSIVLNGLQKYITVVCNAISDFEETLQAETVPGHLTDVVWNYVPEADLKTIANKSENIVETITLNELADVINLTSAVLKLDAPNYDYKILKKAHMLFDKVDITYVFMHWDGKSEQDLLGIADFFVKQDYRALEKYLGKEIDTDTLIISGRSDVVWEKKKPE